MHKRINDQNLRLHRRVQVLRSPLSRGAVSRVLGEAGKPPLFILPLTLTLTYTLRSESSSMFIGVIFFQLAPHFKIH